MTTVDFSFIMGPQFEQTMLRNRLTRLETANQLELGEQLLERLQQLTEKLR